MAPGTRPAVLSEAGREHCQEHCSLTPRQSSEPLPCFHMTVYEACQKSCAAVCVCSKMREHSRHNTEAEAVRLRRALVQGARQPHASIVARQPHASMVAMRLRPMRCEAALCSRRWVQGAEHAALHPNMLLFVETRIWSMYKTWKCS
jgi:hypothetical protein